MRGTYRIAFAVYSKRRRFSPRFNFTFLQLPKLQFCLSRDIADTLSFGWPYTVFVHQKAIRVYTIGRDTLDRSLEVKAAMNRR